MAYDDLFRKRMALSGTSVRDGFKSNTVNLVNKKFADSPYYRQGTTSGGNSVDWRESIWKEDEPYNTRTFRFRPSTQFERGDTFIEGNDTWMVFEFNPFDNIYPFANLMLCNDKLNWKDANGIIHSYPCVTIPYRSIRTIQQDPHTLNMPEGHMFAVVQLNADTKNIVYKQRFFLGNQVYEISGIDDANYAYNDKGLIYFTVTVSTKNSQSDDSVNRIADNSFLYPQNPNNVQTPPTTNGGDVKAW